MVIQQTRTMSRGTSQNPVVEVCFRSATSAAFDLSRGCFGTPIKSYQVNTK